MPDDIRRLARDILKDPVTVQIGQSVPAKTVSHALYPVKQHRKTHLLIELLRDIEAESVLVFTRTKHRAERVAQQLKQAGYRATSLQGNLSQPRRQAALNGFRNGLHKVLVATDVAARGIDILSISHVVNYDMPETIDAYTHRIGRTGRVEKTGDALTFVTSADTSMILSLERVLKATLERRTLKGFDYALPAADNGGGRPPRQPGRRPVHRKRIGNN
jgi:ATP-dependent RNA helicase RhlE